MGKRIGKLAERVKCADCNRKLMPGRGMSIHRAKQHDDRTRRYRHREGGRWVYGKAPHRRGKWPRSANVVSSSR